MLESSFKHSPAHLVTELDHARCETLTDLGKGLHKATGNVILARDSMNGRFVAKITKLKSSIETTIYARGTDFSRCGLW